MLHIVKSAKPLDRLGADLEKAVASHKFGVMAVHDLKETMARKGVDFDQPCRIYEVCNPHQARKVLQADLSISTALPCRISIYQDGGGTCLATIRPTAMLALFNSPALQEVAREVEETIVRIMQEAAG